MQYDHYREKMKRVAAFFARLYTHKLLLLLGLVVLSLVVSVLVATKGHIVLETDCPDEVVYGEKLGYRAYAVLSFMTYEYRTEGSTTWTTEQPRFPGRYQVRATCKTSFGERVYGEVHDYTIRAREITVRVSEAAIRYGDTPKIEANLARGDRLTGTIVYDDPSDPDTRAWVSYDSIRITDKKGQSTMAGYVITDTPVAQLHITQRKLSITVSDASKVFDDYALSYDGYEITGGSLLKGDRLVAVFRATLVDAGTKTNTPELRVFNESGLEVTQMYRMNVSSGKLTVEQRPLMVKTGSEHFVYNGSPVSCTDYEIDPSTPLLPGHTMTAHSPYVIDCGTVDNVLTFEIYDRAGYDETHNYALFVEAGVLEITPRPITVTSESDTRIYNGQAQSVPHVTVTELFDDYEVTEAATIRDVGQVTNTLKLVLRRGSKDVTANYTITYRFGTITVKPRPIQMALQDEYRYYDGTPLTSGTVESVGAYDLAEGHTMTVEGSGRITEVGTISNHYIEGSAVICDREGRVVTDNYDIGAITSGTLTVVARPITVSAASESWVYDARWHSANYCSVTVGSLPEAHTLTAVVEGELCDVGQVVNTLVRESVVIRCNGVDMTRNFNITYMDGTLKVTPYQLVMHTASGTWMYDGEAHAIPYRGVMDNQYGFLGSADSSMPSGHEVVYDTTVYSTVTDVGSVANTTGITIRDSQNGQRDVTSNYEITYTGVLTVTPRPITLCTESTEWIYDGVAHTHRVCSISPNSPYPLVAGHTVSAGVGTPFTDVGEYINRCEALIHDRRNGRDMTSNYEITYEYGTVRIQPRAVTLALDATVTYTGAPIRTVEASVSPDTPLAKGHTAIATISDTVMRVGTAEVKASVAILDAAGRDVSSNYDYDCTGGTLTVVPRPVSIKTADACKRYDGTPLTAPTAEVTADSLSLASGHEIELTVTGSALSVGWYENTFIPSTLRIVDTANGREDVTDQYEVVSLTAGTLTVRYAAALFIETKSATKYYDGLPLTNKQYTIDRDGGMLKQLTVEVSVTGQRTEVGVSENTATVVVWNRQGEDVTDLVDIHLTFGTLTVLESETPPVDRVGRVFADTSGTLYLRMDSYGDYTGQKWTEAEPFAGTWNGSSMNFLPATVLRALGVEAHTLRFSGMDVFMLPYYADPEGDTPSVVSDTVYSTAGYMNYAASYYPYEWDLTWVEAYLSFPAAYRALLLGENAAREAAYRAFVYDQYSTVDAETAAYMQTVIQAEGFESDYPGVIAAVAAYIRSSAVYDAAYDTALDDADNVAVAFLRDYKAGVCRHFATAATLLYRTLGIPARYVTGYMTQTSAGEWADIANPGHAWVEVYVTGLGWVPVEVTGSSGGYRPSEQTELELIPAFAYKIYDGTELLAPDRLMLTPTLEALLEQGYTYRVEIAGTQRELGFGVSHITDFTLYDPEGNDVTENYRLNKQNGILRVTRESVEIRLYQQQKTYDGRPLTFGEGDYAVVRLPDGLTMEAELLVELTEVGMLTLHDLNKDSARYIDCRLYQDGVDVTDRYDVVFVLNEGMTDVEGDASEDVPVAVVKPRPLELTAASETRVYDGEPLLNPSVYISRGSPVEGHTVTATADGICMAVGTVQNPVGTVVIRDAEGRDVTAYYSITTVDGQLTLLADDEG